MVFICLQSCAYAELLNTMCYSWLESLFSAQIFKVTCSFSVFHEPSQVKSLSFSLLNLMCQ